MRRRALLAALGSVGLSGCAGMQADRGDASGTTPPATRTAESPGTSQTTASTTGTTETTAESAETTDSGSDGDDNEWAANASIVDLGTGPRTLALAPLEYRSDDGAAVTVGFASTATDEGPATLRGTLTNANDFPNTFRLDETPPFVAVTDARLDRRDLGYEATWYLVPTENHDLVEGSPGYERGPEGYWRLVDDPYPRLPRTHRLAPGERIEGEWVLLGHAEGSGRPLGTYEFSGHGDATLTVTAWQTGAPGPDDASRFAGASPPGLPGSGGNSGRPHWYHDAGPETAVYLDPDPERARLPARLDFTLYNHAREPVTGNPYQWVLYKLVDGEWFHVAPWGWPMPAGSIPPGDTSDWPLYAFGGRDVAVADGLTVGHLGGGRYAFEVGMSRDDRSHAALFELDGPAVSVAPMPGTESERDGATVRVDAPDPDYDAKPGTLVLTSGETAADRLVPEQVMQPRFSALRNGLPFFDPGVERVVVETTGNAVRRVVGYESNARRFAFEGQPYEAQFEPASEE